MNRHELLYVAVREAAPLAESGWRAPLPALFPVAGRDAIATLQAQLLHMKEGGYNSDYALTVAEKLATALCGGDVDPGYLVTKACMRRQEPKAALALLVKQMSVV